MTMEDTPRVDFIGSLETEDGFDPLADLFEEVVAEDEENSYVPDLPPTQTNQGAGVPAEPKVDTRPAAERIEEMFKRMHAQRRELMAILNACFLPQKSEDVEALVDGMQVDNRSVFKAGNLCMLLERAGGLAHVTEDGTPFVEAQNEPKTVVVDGVEYIEAAEPLQDFWMTTEDGKNYAAADDPRARLVAQLDEEPAYLPVYRQILELCSKEPGETNEGRGMTTKALSDIFDNDPLLRVSAVKRRFTPYFIERLDKCDALEWRGSWVTTEIGHEYLEALAAQGVDAE